MNLIDTNGLLRDFVFGTAWSDEAPEDMLNYDDRYEIHVEMPGVDKKDINIKFEKEVLSISATRKRSYDKDSVVRLTSGRSYSAIRKSYSLPAAVDRDKIEAKCENGILIVKIPKTADAKPKLITVG